MNLQQQIKEALEQKLFEHLGFNGKDGTYIHVLTRVKEAFGYGTMTIDDFVEIDGDFVSDLADLFLTFKPQMVQDELKEAKKQLKDRYGGIPIIRELFQDNKTLRKENERLHTEHAAMRVALEEIAEHGGINMLGLTCSAAARKALSTLSKEESTE